MNKTTEALLARIEKLEAANKLAEEALQRSKRNHYYCEDTWYSCPKAEDGCANDAEGDDCNCGADVLNAENDKALAAIREALEEQELYEPEGRCKECLAYNGHLDYCSKAAKREWVDLTDDEIDLIEQQVYCRTTQKGSRLGVYAVELIRALITAFKEKNK